MTITGTNLGKKFGSHWIFKNLSFEISQGQSVALIGPNGSGKSTLLQVISSALTPSKGDLKYYENVQQIESDQAIQHINFCSPYTEIIEELTLDEHLSFQGQFKKALADNQAIAEHLGLSDALHRPISQFSSGMKQRTKLALQLYFEGHVLALDEPTSNLDEDGKEIYREEVKKLMGNKTILIASNDRSEYDFCEKIIDLGTS